MQSLTCCSSPRIHFSQAVSLFCLLLRSIRVKMLWFFLFLFSVSVSLPFSDHNAQQTNSNSSNSNAEEDIQVQWQIAVWGLATWQKINPLSRIVDLEFNHSWFAKYQQLYCRLLYWLFLSSPLLPLVVRWWDNHHCHCKHIQCYCSKHTWEFCTYLNFDAMWFLCHAQLLIMK